MSDRQPRLTNLARVTLGICAALGVGCCDSSNGGDGVGGSAMSGGAAAAGAGTAGAAGASGAGAGGSASGDAGPGGTGALAGAGGSSGMPEDCPTPSPIPSSAVDTEQVIVIRSVKFGALSTEDTPVVPGEVVLENVSDTDQTILGGAQGWQWCDEPYYGYVVLTTEDVTLAPGETHAFIPFNNMNPWAFDRDGGELAIYTTTGSFDEEIYMRAFASWGVFGCEEDGACGPRRENVAVAGGYWTFSQRIRIGPLDAGFVIVGAADQAQGYESAPARCLVAPPNP